MRLRCDPAVVSCFDGDNNVLLAEMIICRSTFQQWIDDYKTGRPQKPYQRVMQNGSIRAESQEVSTYIRHQIHHPENRNNTHFTLEELKQSIEDMRAYIRDRAEREGIWEPIPEE